MSVTRKDKPYFSSSKISGKDSDWPTLMAGSLGNKKATNISHGLCPKIWCLLIVAWRPSHHAGTPPGIVVPTENFGRNLKNKRLQTTLKLTTELACCL